MEREVAYRGVKLNVTYTVDGHYIPATREYPEEHPELNVIDILVGDVSITDLLIDSQIDEVYDILIEHLEL
jgi:hypothetical protein